MCGEDLHQRQVCWNIVPRPRVPQPRQNIVRRPVLATLRNRLGHKESSRIAAVLHRAQEGIENTFLAPDAYPQPGEKDVVDAAIGQHPRARDKAGYLCELPLVNAHDDPPQRTWERNSSWPCTL